ncbi:TPA: hypothetical protein NKQ61_001733 [Vibrio parahaemolyticus]|nr:hypothetical protein [Vibrio parahaemolyticus]
MALRPVFSPILSHDYCGADEKLVDFKWHPGMATVQKQKSVRELHAAAHALGFKMLLEISSKSELELGVQLSAFNLTFTTQKLHRITVESAFQASKVFKRGGPFTDLMLADSRTAKKDIRLKESGTLDGFQFFGNSFPIKPRTIFYDWIYINALAKNPDLAEQVKNYDGFTDIEFNPRKSINCQAHSAALYVSLFQNGKLNEALDSFSNFSKVLEHHYENQQRTINVQDSLI